MHSTRDKWHSKRLVGEIRICTKSIREGIHRPAQQWFLSGGCLEELLCFQIQKILLVKRITVQLHASIHHTRSWRAWWRNTWESTLQWIKYGMKENWKLQKAYWVQSISSSSTYVSRRRSSGNHRNLAVAFYNYKKAYDKVNGW